MNFWRLVSPEHFADAPLSGHHHHTLCFFAVVLAVMASAVMLPVIKRFHATEQRYRYSWLIAGSVGMGTGIWAMHFTGMLAFSLPVPIDYAPGMTALSIIPAIIASACCIYLFKPQAYSWQRLNGCALLLAAGIGTMHYTGMEAMIVAADMYYVPAYFLLSLLAAYLLALVGLYVRIKLSRFRRLPAFAATVVGSIILGMAISAMHFLAMHATYFQADRTTLTISHSAMPIGLVSAIISVTLLLLGLIIIGSLVDRRMRGMARSLRRSEQRFQRLAETTHTAIFTFKAGRIIYANPALSKITGLSHQQILSSPLVEVFSEAFNLWAQRILDTGTVSDEVFYEQFEITRSGGDPRWVYVSLTRVDIDQQLMGLGSAIDISKQKSAEHTLRQLAYSDPLTKLSNRTRFMDRLEHHLKRLQRQEASSLSCVMILDLDEFKLINDTYGHLNGDKLLVEVARRINTVSRSCDTVARFGGDEFVLLVEGLHADLNIATIAERVMSVLAVPYYFVDREIVMNASIGVVELNHRVYSNCDHVLHDADVALYRAKEDQRGSWVLFDSALDAHTKRSRLIQSELKAALQTRQLQVYYQPIFDANSRQLAGFEALARWQRRTGEWVSPEEFIAVAEKSGMITDIGLWVLEEACLQLHEWQREHPQNGCYISINVASESFADERFYQQIQTLFDRYRLLPGLLKLELTEHMLVKEADSMLARLDSLIELGCELMIDDFGTGYSSLAYLCRLPIGRLKIDRSFVATLMAEDQTAQVVETIIALAKTLKIKVISEGVETEQQARLLTDMGSDQLQGYLLGRPAPVDQASQLLADQRELQAGH